MPKHGGDQGGRPTVFTRELVQQVFDLMHIGTSAIKAVAQIGINWGTWCHWLYNPDQNPTKEDNWFTTSYAHARKACIDYWFWNGHETANDKSADFQPYTKYNQNGAVLETGVKSDNTAVNRCRLMVDTDFKIASRMFPADYGETVKQEITGKNGEALSVTVNIPVKKD